LTEEHVRIRLAFARAWLDFNWLRVLFLDKCPVKKGISKKTIWSFGYLHKGYDYNKVSEYPKGKQGSVIV